MALARKPNAKGKERDGARESAAGWLAAGDDAPMDGSRKTAHQVAQTSRSKGTQAVCEQGDQAVYVRLQGWRPRRLTLSKLSELAVAEVGWRPTMQSAA